MHHARLRAFEPARRLKLDGDVASDSDPARLALVAEPKRSRLTLKYAKGAQALSPNPARAGTVTMPESNAGVSICWRFGAVARVDRQSLCFDCYALPESHVVCELLADLFD